MAKMMMGDWRAKVKAILVVLSRSKLFGEGLLGVSEQVNGDITMHIYKNYYNIAKNLIKSAMVKLASRHMRSLTALSMYPMNRSQFVEIVSEVFPSQVESNMIASQFKNCKIVVFKK